MPLIHHWLIIQGQRSMRGLRPGAVPESGCAPSPPAGRCVWAPGTGRGKKYHETGHMLTVAYQPNHRYRKDWRLLMKESEDFWLATIHFFDRHLKKQ